MNLPAMQSTTTTTTGAAVPVRRSPLFPLRHRTHRRPLSPPVERAPVPTPAPAPAAKVKFDAAFIERRMAEHNAWRKRQEQLLGIEIISEVYEVLADEDRFR